MSSSDGGRILDGRVAVVTGAGSGIGRAVVERYVEEGARVVALDRDGDRLGALSDRLGDAVRVVTADGAQAAGNAEAAALAVSAFGRLDVLVGNIGVFDWNRRIERLDAEALASAFDELFRINLRSHVLAAHACHPALLASRGSAIFTCSNASFRGGGGGPLYTASKFGLRGFIQQLALDWSPEVRVNGVAPGGTVTELGGLAALGSADRRLSQSTARIEAMANATPLGFAAAPEDHAGLYVALASSRFSRAVTGAVFVSDGGLTLSV